jgi:hypothetical protein
VVARLRTADEEHLEDTIRVVGKIVEAIRRRFPRMKIGETAQRTRGFASLGIVDGTGKGTRSPAQKRPSKQGTRQGNEHFA